MTPTAAVALRAGRHPPSIVWFVTAVALVLAGDLALKWWSFAHVAGRPVVLTPELHSDPLFWHRYDHAAVRLVPRLLSLKLTTNTGAVFGLFKGAKWVFVAISILAVAIIGTIFARSRAAAWGLHLGLALILAGALGNLYDRLRFDAVRDMLWLFPGVKLPFGLTWPGGNPELYPWLFNLADAALVVGVGLLILVTWRGHDVPAAPA